MPISIEASYSTTAFDLPPASSLDSEYYSRALMKNTYIN